MAHKRKKHYNPSDLPRKKKKAYKKQAQKILAEKQGIDKSYKAPKLSAAEAQQIIENKRKNDERKARIQSYKNLAISQGIPATIITNKDVASKEKTEAFIAAYKKQQQTEKRRLQNQRRYADKVNRLIDAGFPRAEAEKIVGSPSHQINEEKLKNYLHVVDENTVIEFNQAIYVGFADIMGDGFYMENQNADESYNDIAIRVEEALYNIDNSDGFRAEFYIDFGPPSVMEDKAWAMYERSMKFALKHAHFDGKQYHKITVSNKWSKREFLNMVNSCVQMMANRDVIHFVQNAKNYLSTQNVDWLAGIRTKK